MKGFIAAIQFITILRFGKTKPFDPGAMIPFFPLVGLLLGLIVALFDYLALFLVPKPLVSFLDVFGLILLSGALHLDGLGDTADGLLAHHPPKKALQIMKDSRIGAMGLVAVLCAVMLKWCGLMALENQRFLFIMVIPALARGSMLFGIRSLPYGRSGGGTGQPFFQKPLRPSTFVGLAIVVLISLLGGRKGFFLVAMSFVLTALLLAYYQRRLGCITGDMLGAMTESIEAALFVLAAIQF